MPKKFVPLILLSLPVMADTPTTLIWCLDSLPPRQIHIDGKPPFGPMVDMMKHVAEKLQLELVYSIPTPVNRCLDQLASGEVDIVAGLLKTAEREQQFFLYPFDQARAESWFINTLARVDHKKALRITKIKNRHYSDDFDARYLAAGYQVSEADNIDTALITLFFNDTDVVVGPEHIIQAEIAKNARYSNSLVLTPQKLASATEAHVAIKKSGRHAARNDELIQIFKHIRESGNFNFYD